MKLVQVETVLRPALAASNLEFVAQLLGLQ